MSSARSVHRSRGHKHTGPRLARLTRAGIIAIGLSLFPLAASAQQTDVVAGIVVDGATLNPLDGVQVTVVGTQLGVPTDAGGRFRITGVSGQEVTLQLRRLGYRPGTERVRVGRTDLRLTLSISPAQLNEVVITGTAEPVEKRALGNAVAKIDASQVQAIAPSQNVSGLFNGRAPGVVMIAGSGAVGSGPRIRIRGSSSISLSDQPLIYIDGIRVANDVSTGPQTQFFSSSIITRLNDIDPDDIESIEIVKGPAAATLYGTEANNGVIQIITKRGKAGRAVFTALARQGSNWYNNAEERIGLTFNRSAAGVVQSWNPVAVDRAVGRDLFKTGRTQNYNIGVNGGTDQARYHVSGSYDNETGIEPTNSLWRGAGSANVSLNPRPNFDLNASVNVTRQNIHLPLEAGGGMWFSAYFGQAPKTQLETDRRGYFSAPPEAFWGAFENYQALARTTGSLTMNHRLGQWLSQRLTVGNDLTAEDNVGFTERMGPELRRFFTNPVDQAGGKLSRKRDLNVSTVDYNGTIRATLFNNVGTSTSFGAQYFRRATYIVAARGEEFPTAGLETIDAAARNFGGEASSTNATLGFYAQEQVDIRDRLFLTAAVRVDDNSAFGENFSWITYPKVMASWVINEEPWFKLPYVSAFKVRAAYGHTGQQPATFSALRTYAAIGSGEGVGAVTPSTLGNPDLKAERAKEIEAGFDAAFLNDRLGFEVTGYQKTTEDAIVAATVAPSSGFPGTRLTNLGEVRNRGIEVQLRGNIVESSNFSLAANVNYAANANEILDVGAAPGTPLDQQFIGTGSIRHQVGYPVGSFWDRRVLSAEFVGNTINTRNELCDNARGGTTACFDAAGNIIAPRIFYGRSDSPTEGSFSTTATFLGRFRLFTLVDFKAGNLHFDNNHRARCQAFRICLANLNPTDAELQEHGQTRAPATLMAQYNSNNLLRDVFHQDASYAKLREISASYVIPEQFARRAGFSAATLTISGRNLKTWTGWTGIDPESFFSVEQYARTEQAQVPPLQQFIMSFSVNF